MAEIENEPSSDDNIGSVLQLDLIKIGDITDDSLANFAYTTKLQLFFAPETARFREKGKRNQNGKSYDASISFTVPNIRAALIDWLNDNDLQYFVCIVQDANGLVRKAGTKKKPLQLFVDLDTGDKYASLNHTVCELKGTFLSISKKIDLSDLYLFQFQNGANFLFQNNSNFILQ